MKPPKVAHIATVDVSLRYLLLNQMRYIQAQGYEVVGISSPGPEVALIEAGGIRHIAAPLSRRLSIWSDVVAFFTLVGVLRRERFDVIHTHTPKAALLGQYAAALARVPVRVHTIHGLYLPEGVTPLKRWLYTLLERVIMLPSHLNFSQNPEDMQVVIREKICPARKVQFLGNGIELGSFDPATYTPERRAEVRAGLGLGPEHKVVGIVARFKAWKGYLDLFEAAGLLREKVPGLRVLCVGKPDEGKKDALRPEVIEEMGMGDVVKFLGQRRDVADLYSAMDVLTLPSVLEGLPRTLMEGAAMGLPAVATDIRGCRPAVDHGVTGYLIPVHDPPALAEALRELLTDDDRRAAFGRAARKKALAEFDERRVFARITEAYGDLLNPRTRAAPLRADPTLGRPASRAVDPQRP